MKKTLALFVLALILVPASFAKDASGGQSADTTAADTTAVSQATETTTSPDAEKEAAAKTAEDEAAKARADKKAAEEAAKAETVKKTAEEAAAKAAEDEAAKAEADRKAAEENAAKAAVEEAAAKAEAEKKAANDAAAKAEAEKKSAEEAAKAEVQKKAAEEAAKAAAADPALTEGRKHCGEYATLAERVSCRVSAKPETIQKELDTAYFPEGCRTGSTEWQENCKARYKMIGPCWTTTGLTHEQYNGNKVISCLKGFLKLPEKLVRAEVYCKDKESNCALEYKKTVLDLIVSRFYDSEQRAEMIFAKGLISKEDLVQIIVKISEAKIAFYKAESKDMRKRVIHELGLQWAEFVKKIKK